MLHATTHYYRVLTSGHSFLRKLWLSFIFLYNLVQMLFQVLGPSSFYLAFVFLMESATASDASDPFGGYGDDVLSVCSSLYIATLGVTVICALGNKPAASKWWYTLVIAIFAALFAIEFYCAIWTVYLAVPHTVAGWKDVSALMDNSVRRSAFATAPRPDPPRTAANQSPSFPPPLDPPFSRRSLTLSSRSVRPTACIWLARSCTLSRGTCSPPSSSTCSSCPRSSTS